MYEKLFAAKQRIPKATVVELSCWRRFWHRLRSYRTLFWEQATRYPDATVTPTEPPKPTPPRQRTRFDIALSVLEQIRKDDLRYDFVCRCGHPLAHHGRSALSPDIICFHKDCDCQVSEAAIAYAKNPLDPFRPGPPDLLHDQAVGYIFGDPWPRPSYSSPSERGYIPLVVLDVGEDGGQTGDGPDEHSGSMPSVRSDDEAN